MHSRIIAGLLSLAFLTSGAQSLAGDVAFRIEYPIPRYRLVDRGPDSTTRTSQVVALRQRLTRELSVELVQVAPSDGAPSVATDLRLARAVKPIRIIWNDPRYFFRAPVILEWLELIDERGRVTRVWVTASNQSPRGDRRIIGWCTNDALWKPSDLEGRVVRSAGVTLVSSPFNYTYWRDRLRTKEGILVLIGIAAFIIWVTARIVSFRQDARTRHEELMARLHCSSPYRPPSIDDER